MKFIIRSKKDVRKLMECVKGGFANLRNYEGSSYGGFYKMPERYEMEYLNKGIWLGGGWGAWVHLAWDYEDKVWMQWLKARGRPSYTVPRPISEEEAMALLWKDRKSVNKLLREVEWD